MGYELKLIFIIAQEVALSTGRFACLVVHQVAASGEQRTGIATTGTRARSATVPGMRTMKAMVARAWGEPDTLEYAEVLRPRPGAREVLLDVRAVGCNFPDILMVQGRYQRKPPFPFSPGHEVSGVVAELGDGVQGPAVGTRVIALVDHGAYAEAVAVAADRVHPIPDALGDEAAAAFGIVYQTAWCALVHRAALRPGETLLVHAAAGGVGLAAVQVGRALGARVIACAGTEAKRQLALTHGADAAVDYGVAGWPDQVRALTGERGVNVVFDPVGGDVFDGSTRCVASEGRILVVGFAGGRIAEIATNRILLKNLSVIGVHWGSYEPAIVAAWMQRLLALHAAGQIAPVIWRSYALRDAAAALAALGARESHGKIVLVP